MSGVNGETTRRPGHFGRFSVTEKQKDFREMRQLMDSFDEGTDTMMSQMKDSKWRGVLLY